MFQRIVTSYRYFSELYLAVFVVLVIAIAGSFGYMTLEDYTFGEALYMTIITVSTVGFKEVRDLSAEGRYFTIALIVSSFGIFAFAISSISKYFFSGTYARYRKQLSMDTTIKNLNNHTIICGAGKNGAEAIKILLKHSRDLVIIDNNESIIQELKENKLLVVEGDATDEEVLISAGISRAYAVVTTLPRDTDNVFVVLTARELNSRARIVSRCVAESSRSKLKIAGANDIINPDKVGGAHMAGFVINRNIINFMEVIGLSGSEEELILGANRESLSANDSSNKTMSDLIEALDTECTLIGLKNDLGRFVVNPKKKEDINTAVEVFFIGNKEQVSQLKAKLGKSSWV
jgi:voltage-gated potassium channel